MKNKFILVSIFSYLLFIFNTKNSKIVIDLIISDGYSEKNKKYYIGAKYKIKFRQISYDKYKNISLKLSNKKGRIIKNNLLMVSNGKECLSAYSDMFHSTICFYIYNTPNLKFKENRPIKIETNSNKKLKLDFKDYPESYIKYESSHPDIIRVDNHGKITALRPGNSIIKAYGLDSKFTQINVLSIINNGLITNDIMNRSNINAYKNIMIVAHPDDETIWGGANMIRENYFIICLTNGYNSVRANDFKNVMKFTKNDGIILNYPDINDGNIDNWLEVRNGILKDLSKLISYKNWDKIVTHGPEGTNGHYHHKKTSQFVTEITKKYNKYNNLYYFQKFYNKNEIPKNLPRINDNEYNYKLKEVSIYKNKKENIYRLFLHMLPFENLILASKYNINKN